MYTRYDNFRLAARSAGREIDRNLAPLLEKRFQLAPGSAASYTILSRRIDSRGREPILDYKLLVEAPELLPGGSAATPDELAALFPAELPIPERITLPINPIVVGTGPAGIFAAYLLAASGVQPVILERGSPIEERVAGQRRFLRDRKLDEADNLLIGEGGAGAFSDGKLYTGTRDRLGRLVIDTLVQMGAAPELRYRARPHVGSDYLHKIGVNFRHRIEALGGSFQFHAEVVDVLVESGRCVGVVLADGKVLRAPAVVLAPGLGGRKLLKHLAGKIACVPKPFQIGCRIEHPQEWVDLRQYHGSRPAALEAAEYHLVSGRHPGAPQMSSFCMCPGGRIVNASAWCGQSATNGVSDYARSGEFANSCLIATLLPEHYGDIASAWERIEHYEKAIFAAGGGDYSFPAQDAAAFLAGRPGLSGEITSCETGIVSGRLDRLIDPFLRTALNRALRDFDRKMPGFIRYGKLVGMESCVSSPVRVVRNERNETSLPGLFVCGEGVGGAGGIVSGACDGMRTALALLQSPGKV